MSEGIITIHKGREKPIRQQHPWIFSGAIENAKGANAGDLVTVVSHDGQFMARGYWNPKSQIQVRILTWQDEAINDDWWLRMLRRAVEGRGLKHFLLESGENRQAGYRMINAENDFIPGLIVDRYGEWLVLQSLTLGIEAQKERIVEMLTTLTKTEGLYERSDVDVRGKEGLKPAQGLLKGNEPPDYITIVEHGVKSYVDVRRGHKTGSYLDQAANRRMVYDLITEDFDSGICRLLNLFSYTGGFGLQALAAGGAHVVNVDSSREALEVAEKNIALNELDRDKQAQSYELIQADVFEYLRDAVARGELFDVIVCDPPKFAHNAQQVEKAARGYKDLNLNCFRLIKPGGYLMTFSCSGAISADLFQKIVFGALADSGRQAQILKHLGPGDDHPVALTFPEGAYLKGLLLRVF